MGIKNFASLSILILFFTLAQTATAQERHVAKYVPRPEVKTIKTSEIVFSEDHLKLLKAELLKLSKDDKSLYNRAITEMENQLKNGVKVLFVNEYKPIQVQISNLEEANRNESIEETYQERKILINRLKAGNISTSQIIQNLNK